VSKSSSSRLAYYTSKSTIHNNNNKLQLILINITYSITKPNTLLNLTKRLSGTNLCYVSLILSLLNKKPITYSTTKLVKLLN
jgi:hypothetical protein